MNTRNLPRLAAAVIAAFAAGLICPSVGYAQLPDPLPASVIAFDSGGKTHYDFTSRLLSADASALNILLPGQPPAKIQAATGTSGSLACNPSSDCGTVTIRARVNNSGVLAGGIAGPDLTIVGKVVDPFGATVADGILVIGDVKEFFIGADKFELRFSITGGLLKDLGSFNQCGDWGTALCEIGTSVGVTLPAGSLLTPFTGSFANNFDGGAFGWAGAIQPVGFLDPTLDQCTGGIGDFVWNDLNDNGIQDAGELGFPGFAVALTGGPDNIAASVNSDANGKYLFGALCAGTYHVQVSPNGYTSTNGATADVTLPVGAVNLAIDFGLYLPPPPPSTPFYTASQGGWGSKPHPKNPGGLLLDNFGIVFPGANPAVVIGDSFSSCAGGTTFKITLTSAAAIQNFLPQGGKPTRLTKCETNPISKDSKISVLAGQVLALKLNVAFSDAGVSRPGLANLSVVSGRLAGWTVNMVLAAGNTALGGGATPGGITLADLNDVIAKINENFDGGTIDRAYLH